MNSSYFTSGNPYYNAPDPYNHYLNDGWLRGQCTWYVWGRCSETGWNIGYKGNADGFYDNVQGSSGKDLNPQVGDIMCLPILSSTGHVAIVVQVNSFNSWVIDEYNINDGAPNNPQWSRETVTRDPNNSTRVEGELFKWTTLKGFVHSPVSGGSSTDYYVSLNGNDGSNGSSSTPFRTIKHAIDAVNTPQLVTIHIAPGSYGERIGTSKHIHFVTWGSGTVQTGG